MTRIGVRELRQHASRYLDVVKSGGTVEVTERGKLIALIVPASPAASQLERLVAAGRVSPATTPFRVPGRRPTATAGAGSAELAGQRDDRSR